MSKINRIRIVNLNYNNKAIRVDDELFNLDCEDTMMSLRNGGGKTVLVQMIMAPFINKKYRDIGKRKFDSYFSSSIPTYILVEWKLDHGSGYVMNGMVVRKREILGDEESASKLDIINFVYEYSEKNLYDIKNMPFVRSGDKGRKFESYLNCKKLFEQLKKNKNYKFNYYDMTNSSTTSAYFRKLNEYEINHREWENIIRKINQKESGLSDLFVNAKNVTGLLKEWFIPAVEGKISKEYDRIKAFRDIINKYIKNFKDNKSKIDKKEKMELFNTLSEDIKTVVKKSVDISNNREELENEIANIIVYLKGEFDEKTTQVKEAEEAIDELQSKLRDIEYEENSLKIYKEKDKYEVLSKKCQLSKLEHSKKEVELDNLQRKIYMYDCAQLYANYEKCSKELQRLEEDMKSFKEERGDMTPRIEDLGYTMGIMLEEDKNKILQKEKNKKQRIETLENKKLEKNKEIESNGGILNSLKKREGRLEADIEHFNKAEEKFNNNNNERFQRNIERVYDESKLATFKNDWNNLEIDLIKEERMFSTKLMENEDKKRVVDSQIKTINNDIIKNKSDLKWNKEELIKIEEELQKRREILKYVDLNQKDLFNNEKILRKFDDKITLLIDEQRLIKNNIDKEKSEIYKLETGKVMEISEELQNELIANDIRIVYGMEWLKKNMRSEKENLEIIKNNPLLPYALIMEENDIAKLEQIHLEVYTSTPIVIVRRDRIKQDLAYNTSNMVALNGINFLVSFNKKLLNEQELKNLIEKKKELIREYNVNLHNINDDINLYSEKKACIQGSNITKESYESLNGNIEDLNTIKDNLDKKSIELNSELSVIEKEISSIFSKKEDIKKSIDSVRKKLQGLSELIELYSEYKKTLLDLREVKKNIDNTESVIKSLKSFIINIEYELKDLNHIINNYGVEKSSIDRELKKYATHKNGKFIKKDREDIIAEYQSLTHKITSTEQQLKEKIAEADEAYKSAQNILETRSDDYGIKEIDYREVTYNIDEEQQLKGELYKGKITLKDINSNLSGIEKDMVILETQIKGLQKAFKEKFGTDILKLGENIFEKNYDEEKNKVNIAIKNTEKVKKELERNKGELDKNIVNLKDYSDLKVKNIIEIKLNIEDLSDTIGKKRRELKKLSMEYGDSINIIQREINSKLGQNKNFIGDDSFSQPIEIFARLIEKPQELILQIDTIINSYVSTMEKLKHDISLVKKEEESILDDLIQYISDINNNLMDIDKNSTINVRGKSRKMLNIIVDDWDENKEIYRVKLRDYCDGIRDHGLKLLNKNENIEDMISSKITSYNLYNEVVGVSTVKVKLFKIEEERQRQISWDDVATNSGGEGFLSSFIILSSLLSYTRRNLNDLFSRGESGKVLIMDNPFAQTSSSHLLKPLMEMAKKSNTQLICFTGLGGESIYDRFDNIYVLNTKQSKLQNGTQYLRGEHKKGQGDEALNEGLGDEYEYLESARTQIREQMRLF